MSVCTELPDGDNVLRPFCIRVRWPGKKAMLVGGGKTFFIRGRHPAQHEIAHTAKIAVEEWVTESLPPVSSLPMIEAVLFGTLVFTEDTL